MKITIIYPRSCASGAMRIRLGDSQDLNLNLFFFSAIDKKCFWLSPSFSYSYQRIWPASQGYNVAKVK